MTYTGSCVKREIAISAVHRGVGKSTLHHHHRS